MLEEGPVGEVLVWVLSPRCDYGLAREPERMRRRRRTTSGWSGGAGLHSESYEVPQAMAMQTSAFSRRIKNFSVVQGGLSDRNETSSNRRALRIHNSVFLGQVELSFGVTKRDAVR